MGIFIRLGISTGTYYGLKRNQNRYMLRTIQNVMNNIRMRTTDNMPSVAVVTELAKELVPSIKSFPKKINVSSFRNALHCDGHFLNEEI